ncbi:hypothetical protein NLU13_4439 [Sarocladium strictum]|uniref:UDP-N-acetylglucosamine transferase subunit ALG14 n=1 Tax=Sarocladium strictum TaxID=5046 RepID=A0AA39GKJ7_SARSR|nr:hypothetical protein NLU13_4439 [Sarocladium strictum]
MGKISISSHMAPRRAYIATSVCLLITIVVAPWILQASWLQILLTYLAVNGFMLNGLLVFMALRHLQLIANRRLYNWPQLSAADSRPADYFLFVLGSGGHTKEMLMMMDDGTSNFANLHRRYLISSGDNMSLDHMQDYESELRELCTQKGHESGTYDTRLVTRARRVHQSLLTTPLTALLSVLDIFPALLTSPTGVSLWPQRIYSNGPATGFFVALVAHLLRMFFLVPEDSMRFIYIESWARISTLSLTGKLLHYSGLADVFVVQHKELAERYGVRYAGEMVFNSRRMDT